jgi:hypothetical protein
MNELRNGYCAGAVDDVVAQPQYMHKLSVIICTIIRADAKRTRSLELCLDTLGCNMATHCLNTLGDVTIMVLSLTWRSLNFP